MAALRRILGLVAVLVIALAFLPGCHGGGSGHGGHSGHGNSR